MSHCGLWLLCVYSLWLLLFTWRWCIVVYSEWPSISLCLALVSTAQYIAVLLRACYMCHVIQLMIQAGCRYVSSSSACRSLALSWVSNIERVFNTSPVSTWYQLTGYDAVSDVVSCKAAVYRKCTSMPWRTLFQQHKMLTYFLWFEITNALYCTERNNMARWQCFSVSRVSKSGVL